MFVERSQLLLRMSIDRRLAGGRDRRMLPSELGAIRERDVIERRSIEDRQRLVKAERR